MKKVSALLVMGSLVAVLSACGGAQPAAPAAPAPAPAAPAAAAPAADAPAAGSSLDFELVNATGYDIKELYLSPSTVQSWEENMIPADKVFANGTSLPLKFAGYKPDVQLWDLKAVEVADPTSPHIYTGLNLTQITKVTLNAEDAKTE